MSSHIFSVADGETRDLDLMANELRLQIEQLPPDEPQLAKTVLADHARLF